MRDRMRTKSYDTLEKEAIAESLGISLNKYRYIERRIAESDNPNDTVENWLKEGKIRLRKTKEEVKEAKEEKAKEEKAKEEKAKKSDTENKKDKEADTDSDTNTESNDETKDSIVNDDVEIKDIEIKDVETKEEKVSKSTSKSTSTTNTNKHICDRCHSKIKDSEYNLNLSYLINGLAGYRFKIDSSRVKLCHDCAIELGKVVEGWLIDNGNGVKVKPWMGDDNKEDKEEDREVDGFDDFNFNF